MIKKRIKNPIQLVIQSNDCQLFSAQPISELFAKSNGIAGDVGPEPNRAVYLEKNGNGKYFIDEKYHLKQKIEYVQKINIDYILQKGLSYNWGYDFPVRLYEQFIKIETKKELAKFVEKMDFCIFPKESEIGGLKADYKNALLAENVHHIEANFPLEESLKNRVQENQKLIREINLDFLWNKKELLKTMVARFNSKEMIYHDFLWLNGQIENISDILLDPQHFSMKKISPTYEEANDQSSGDLYRMKKLWQTMLVPGHRIYGHFALCCFEFFLDIKEDIAMIICPYCGRVVGLKNGKKSRCGNENPACVLLQKSEDRKKRRTTLRKLGTSLRMKKIKNTLS